MNYSDTGIILEILGFLFAFGIFRFRIYLLYETFRIVWMFILYVIRMDKHVYKKIKLYPIKKLLKFNKKILIDFLITYHDSHLHKLTSGGEERWPRLQKIVKFIGWMLITLGLVLQHSFFNSYPTS